MFDPMSELTSGEDIQDDEQQQDDGAGQKSGGQRSGKYAQEVDSITIHARQRTFYIDLKESSHGKFFKVSEKSRGGRKSTIMFDAEDLEKFIEAFQQMQERM